MKKEFLIAFQITKKIIFTVNYYTCGSNNHPYFATEADEFNQPKTDYSRCGQAQDALLCKGTLARRFWEKWDGKHLEDLTQEEYDEMVTDVEVLKGKYNYYFKDYSERTKPYCSCASFETIKDLSKMKLGQAIALTY